MNIKCVSFSIMSHEDLLKEFIDTTKTIDHYILLHVHLKDTDQMDLNDVAKEFVRRNERRVGYFGNF